MIWNETGFLNALLGGAMIGAAAGLFFWINGRIAGISGMTASLLTRWSFDTVEKAAFLIGLPLGAFLFRQLGSDTPLTVNASPATLAMAGLLVGFGARLGNGCTSGHGVCGLARLSPNSIVATAVFMSAAMACVAIRSFL